MSKGLEALVRIEDLLNRLYETDVINDDHTHDINIIGEALKRLEELEKAFHSLSKDDEKAKKLLSKEIEKNRALNEILSLHDKWLGYEMSDFEFFTLLSEMKDKYGLSKEVLKNE